MKLAYAARRAVFVGLLTALSFTVTAQAFAQTSECPRVSGTARRDGVPLSAERIIADQNSSVDLLQSALGDCQRVLTASRNNSTPALLCVSRAQLEYARRGIDAQTNLTAARGNLCRINGLGGVDGATRTQASILRAQALVGLRRGNVGADQAAAYGRELQQVHDTVGSQLTPDVHAAVAQIALDRGDIAGARAEAQRDLQGGARAQVLISVADWEKTHGGNWQQTLQDAYNADRTSVATNARLGAAYFDGGDWRSADPYLRTATGISPPPAGEEGWQQQAFYYLSVIEGDRHNFMRATDYGDKAGNEARALRQSCLVRVMMGREQVYARAPGSNGRLGPEIPIRDLPGYDRCNRLGTSAEGQLAIGMFWLRRAQYMPAPTLGTSDEQRYHDALAVATGALRAQSDATTKLGWPVPGVGDHPTQREMLDYGQRLVSWFDGFCRGAAPTDGGTGAAAVFRYYGISQCAPY